MSEKGWGWGASSQSFLPQHLHIPTMENGPELILRFHKELKAIQVRCTCWEMGWMLVPFHTEIHIPRASGLRLPSPSPIVPQADNGSSHQPLGPGLSFLSLSLCGPAHFLGLNYPFLCASGALA